jgi:hypothetical protein
MRAIGGVGQTSNLRAIALLAYWLREIKEESSVVAYCGLCIFFSLLNYSIDRADGAQQKVTELWLLLSKTDDEILILH